MGLFGQDFSGPDVSGLFGTVIVKALEAVISGSLHDLIRGSLMVSLELFGLSLLARPFWPDLKLASFRRAILWSIAIQAYLLNAPGIYTELETWRVNLSEEVASAVSADAIPGCSGSVVEQLLCITAASPAEVLDNTADLAQSLTQIAQDPTRSLDEADFGRIVEIAEAKGDYRRYDVQLVP